MKLGIRIWVLIAFILFSIVAISPRFNVEGVEISSVGGIALEQGLSTGEIIKEVNGAKIYTVADFNKALEKSNIEPKEIILKTDKGVFLYNVTNDLKFVLGDNLTIKSSSIKDVNNGDKVIAINNVNLESNLELDEIKYNILPSSKVDIKTDKRNYAFLAYGDLDIDVKEPRKNNIKKGLDLEGGTRVLLKPVSNESVSSKDVQDLISVLYNRLNIYGLTDLKIREANSGDDKLVLIEIAGVSKGEIEGFIAQQGKFEAKINDKVAFSGEKEDIPFVCRDDGTCSGIQACTQTNTNSYSCRFQFTIRLSPDAAKRHAEITKDLDVIASEGGQNILSEQIEFYLDEELFDSLNIDASLKGSESTDIQITGPGNGVNEKEAQDDALFNMKRLQTVLITGSLPFKLEVVKLDSISPVFGRNLIKNAFLAGLAAVLGVLAVIYFRYKNLKVVLPMAVTIFSEVLIVIGMAAAIGWNLDLSAIAGIIAAIGTGVDDQIVITDEIMRGQRERFLNWKERIKKAFSIIWIAFFATVVAMLPLWGAAAGLLRGFAITTILGVSIGVLITRPAFAAMVEKLISE